MRASESIARACSFANRVAAGSPCHLSNESCLFHVACCERCRAERRRARHAVEAERVAASKRADQLEEAWGEDTTDEDEPEVARYTRERAQILEVRLYFVRSTPLTKWGIR